jgi:hypothetical protein
MDVGRLKFLDAGIEGLDEALPLLNANRQRRPYQAYCATETSSRPHSPETLIPRPLRISFSATKPLKHAPSLSITASGLSLARTSEQDECLAISSELEERIDTPETVLNHQTSSRSTTPIIEHHLAQAVTPRGSHQLASPQTLMYYRTPSHVRMQQAAPIHVATSRIAHRKPIPQHVAPVDMELHPLPPLPVQLAVTHSFNESETKTQPEHCRSIDSNHASERTQTRESTNHRNQEEPPWARRCSENVTWPPLTAGTYSYRKPLPSNDSAPISDQLPSLGTQVPYETAYFRNSSRSPRHADILDAHAQLPSSAELYTPRGSFSDIDNDRCAQRRTRPKDAKLKYQFGRRPSVKLEISSSTPAHRNKPTYDKQANSYNDSIQGLGDDYFDHAPPSASYQDIQAGPRPPPWGSFESLEMQRRSRGDARERDQAYQYRIATDSASSIHKGSRSMHSYDSPRREVNEFRDQILLLYPDMEFDGHAGESGRGCCFCVVM